MKADCPACSPKTNDALCPVHRRAYTMLDLLRELQDAYLERAQGILNRQALPDEGRLARTMAKVPTLLSIIQAEDRK